MGQQWNTKSKKELKQNKKKKEKKHAYSSTIPKRKGRKQVL